jgi:hypothetical protein
MREKAKVTGIDEGYRKNLIMFRQNQRKLLLLSYPLAQKAVLLRVNPHYFPARP